MHQLINPVSQETAARCDFFPYNFGHYTSVLSWVDTKKRGQRLMTRTYNPYSKSWPKPKESAYYDLVFLFRNPYTGFAEEQCINLHTCTDADMLHIAAHYYLTPHQREVLLQHMRRLKGGVRVVWSNYGLSLNPQFVDIPPFTPVKSEVLVSYPNPDNIIPVPEPLAIPKPAGRPSATAHLSEVDKKRLKLHDKEARELDPHKRITYYAVVGKPNPDNLSDEQVLAS